MVEFYSAVVDLENFTWDGKGWQAILAGWHGVVISAQYN